MSGQSNNYNDMEVIGSANTLVRTVMFCSGVQYSLEWGSLCVFLG